MSNYGNQVITEMARYLRENPSATVNHLAEHMGWAENRSVYYWLHQAGFKGIRDFRKAALGRTIALTDEDILRDSPVKAYLPVVNRITSPKHYEYANEDFLCLIKTSPRAFAYIINEKCWEPLLQYGDILVVDPEIKPEEQDFFLVWVRGKGAIILKKLGEDYYALDPYAQEILRSSSYFFIGSVLLLYRLRSKS